ncbi:hypothetical protein [Gryllotalpicola koreensis]|uniref:DUF5134 domain-containing protein n=1 Tax=Gryllotalpicola koreensis TaxID=993086 RepID=A0ABP8A2B1_9MICO
MTTTELIGAARGRWAARRAVAWRGPAAMAVMVAGMLDTMVPGLHLVSAVLWVALELGLALIVAVPGRGARCCTPLAAHRALGLIVMAALTVAMAGTMTDAGSVPASSGMAMPGMGAGLGVAPLALAAGAAYTAWSVWRARRHEARVEMLLSAASVALMCAFAF